MEYKKNFADLLIVRRLKIICLSLGIVLTGSACGGDKSAKISLKTEDDKASYSVGYDFGNGIRQNLEGVDLDLFVAGLKDAYKDQEPRLTKEEMQNAITAYRGKVMEARREKMQAAAEENKKAGEEFLAANKDKKGVVSLPSGLQYKVLVDGSGKKPGPDDTVEVNYRGTLIDGTEFDSSYNRGQPATFQVKGVIKGWVEALQLMKEGAKWQLFIPADLAYGDRGAGQIGPGSMLIFEVELLKIK